ncbi:hypothetical protein E2C01_065895 [Portunus trituberculatus]|uniref:Uncharacterized protein n=1 Tax=Portunus trituberculatus TaxID=210409 RepID=A0A5B7HFS1_PORTR|nr:hypothetical protein [Portunus trituberculatus]
MRICQVMSVCDNDLSSSSNSSSSSSSSGSGGGSVRFPLFPPASSPLLSLTQDCSLLNLFLHIFHRLPVIPHADTPQFNSICRH